MEDLPRYREQFREIHLSAYIEFFVSFQHFYYTDNTFSNGETNENTEKQKVSQIITFRNNCH